MTEENCGVVGVYSNKNCSEKIFYSIFKLQHRGQKYCGISTFNKKINLITHEGFVRHSFTQSELKNLSGNYGIGHVSLKEKQPILLESRLGTFSIAFAGNIINFDDLFKSSILSDRNHRVQAWVSTRPVSYLRHAGFFGVHVLLSDVRRCFFWQPHLEELRMVRIPR